MRAQADESRTLNSCQISEVNEILDAAERLWLVRGISSNKFGIFWEGPWQIMACNYQDRHLKLVIAYGGQEVFSCFWSSEYASGHLVTDKPGPWRAELLAKPVYDA